MNKSADIYRNFPTIVFLFLTTLPSYTQAISKISYYSGGMTGYTQLTVTKDLIFYESGGPPKKIMAKEKTTKKFWRSLTGTMTIKEFQQIKSYDIGTETDPTITKITIETNNENYSVSEPAIYPLINKNAFKFYMIIRNKIEEIYLKNK